MILVDANLLIYAHAKGMREHERARDWLDSRMSGTARIGLAWPSLTAFLRIVTNPRIFERPQSVAEAWTQVTEWLACEPVWIPQPTPKHPDVLGDLLLQGAPVSANLIPDAHLAALAIEHGLTLCSTDGDFARFESLRWENPLTSL